MYKMSEEEKRYEEQAEYDAWMERKRKAREKNRLRDPQDCKVIRDYKGFRSREAPDSDNYQNAFYVREDGTEICIGQTNDITRTAEGHIRYPLPSWMTGRPAAYSAYYDERHVKNTCAHGVSLDSVCDSCAESYGSARML